MDEEDNSQSPAQEKVDKEIKFVVPKSKNRLRACLRCRLIKSQQQWNRELKCDNCGSFKDPDFRRFTTEKFENIVSMLDPSASWLRRKLKFSKKMVSGAYALNTR